LYACPHPNCLHGIVSSPSTKYCTNSQAPNYRTHRRKFLQCTPMYSIHCRNFRLRHVHECVCANCALPVSIFACLTAHVHSASGQWHQCGVRCAGPLRSARRRVELEGSGTRHAATRLASPKRKSAKWDGLLVSRLARRIGSSTASTRCQHHRLGLGGPARGSGCAASGSAGCYAYGLRCNLDGRCPGAGVRGGELRLPCNKFPPPAPRLCLWRTR